MVIQPCYVLIISQQTLFMEALARLIHTAGLQVQGRAANLEAALALLQTQTIDAVIVDQSGFSQSQGEIIACLAAQMEHYTVVFLTSDNDQLTVYRREQLTYTTPDHLVQLLQLPT